MDQRDREAHAPGHSLRDGNLKHHSGYTFEVLRADGDYTLFRRHGPGPSSVLALAASEHPAPPRTLERLVHELGFAAELQATWAAKPLALERLDGRMMLLLHDCGGTPLDQVLQSARDHRLHLAAFLQVACELARALRQLHARGVIHKDIRPANILLGPAGKVRLSGFGMASRLPRERQPPAPPEHIAGALPYMAPEQTGRMNRSVDSRSDLYSLGVTLFEMLTGGLPFTASEPMEWIHCHVARAPPAPGERLQGVPAALDAILLKLLAKDAEDRFQTAAGVEADLRICLTDWQARGSIRHLRPGERDFPDRLLVPEKLYGREAEIGSLLAAFQRVAQDGRTELVLVSGYSGVGKSSLVSELHKALVPARGLFACGKFDQYKRDIPHATLAQAFQGLVRQLLGKKDEELKPWRERLQESLGSNGQLMVNLIPELALLIGEQPPIPRVDPQDAAARFHAVFRSLLGVFARPEHPLVLFVDDLQWMDVATLELLQRLVTDPDIRHLMVIGAYRDNEVAAAHPLARTLEAIRSSRAAVAELTLAPLQGAHVAQLCADTLHTTVHRAASLADLVSEKTAGNPFFAIQFIMELAEEGLLAFDAEAARWQWDVARIRAKGITDNVAHLMQGKLSRLHASTREALGQLACLGNGAELRVLAVLRGTSEDAVGETLREAVDAGLVQRAGNAFVFSHDRVHEAAYALVPPQEQPMAHLGIGRVLLQLAPPAEVEDGIFEIVNHFHRGAAAIETAAERRQVAELSLRAAKRAKTSSAYASANAYAIAALALLGRAGWVDHYALMFELELQRAECEIVLGDLAAAEERLDLLSGRAAGLADQAAAVCLKVLLCFTTGRYEHAADVALRFLSLAGIEWTAHPSEALVREEYLEMRRQLARRDAQNLVELAPMSDPKVIATMTVLTELFPAAYAVDRYLLDLVLLRMTNLSLRYGNHESSSVAYSALNMALGSHFCDYGTAYRLGQTACELVEQRGMDRYKARVYCCFATFAMLWIQPVSRCVTLLRESFRAGSSMGDEGFAAYTSRVLASHLLVSGMPLDQVQREIEGIFAFVRGVELGMSTERFIAQLDLVKSLRGLHTEPAGADDRWASQDVESQPQLAMMVCYHAIFRLEERYFAGDLRGGLQAVAQVGSRRWTLRSTIEEAEYDFYAALCHAGCADEADGTQRKRHLQDLVDHHERIAFWAGNCPDNFGHRKALVGAEIARLQGRQLEAQDLYEEALDLARKHGFLQHEAIANELAGQCYARRGLKTVADAYLLNARNCYERWGAVKKVRGIDQRHPHLRALTMPTSLAATINKPVAQLDVATVDKASQTLSSEMALPSLLAKLMRLSVEHAGAQRGVLVLADGEEARVEADATTGAERVEVAVHSVPVTARHLPLCVLQYVLRTRERLVLDDASGGEPAPDDEYMRSVRPRSVLCLPIFKQAEVVGALYLENNLATGVFTADRVAVLDFLASQAAIALENAKLYSDLRRSETWLTEVQHLSLTGSFYWYTGSDKVEFSAQTFRIYEIDPHQDVTLATMVDRCHPDDRALFQRIIDIARGPGDDLDYLYRVLVHGDSLKYLRLVAHATRHQDGRLAYIGAIQDVTQSRRAEEALGKARSELAHVVRVTSLGALTASIAHEVNQPLTGIITNASTCLRMLAVEPPNLEGARETLRRMIRDGNRAGDVIKRLRALFSKEEVTSEAVDLNAATREVIALSATELQQGRVILQTELCERLPTVTGDRVQLQQVVLNLLLNACEAMSTIAGRPRVVVIRTALGEDQCVTLSVEDSGPGIEAESTDKLFEAFYTTKEDGMGMGLSVSRSIIESHNGRIWARPNAGAGATFWFSVPCGPAGASQAIRPGAARAELVTRQGAAATH